MSCDHDEESGLRKHLDLTIPAKRDSGVADGAIRICSYRLASNPNEIIVKVIGDGIEALDVVKMLGVNQVF